MAERVVLHVGTMKSGTTFLQGLLFAEKARLADDKVRVPGEVWTDQAKAVRQALGAPDGEPRPQWDAMLEEVRSAPHTAVISMEYLGPARPATIARVVDELAALHVSVVITARDLNRTLVSMWQETIQNGRSWTWEDYLADVEAKSPGGLAPAEADQLTPGGTFWRQQDLVRMLSDWSAVVGPDHVTLVTVPHPGAPAETLAQRFGAATGLDLDPRREVPGSNPSLGLASLLVLRRVNELLDERGLAFPLAQGLRKKKLAKIVLAARRGIEPSLGLATPSWVREQSARTVAALGGSGVRLVGSWSDLEPADVSGVRPDQVPLGEVHEAALEGLAGLIAEVYGKRR